VGTDAWGFDEDRQRMARRLRSKRLRLQALHTTAWGVIVLLLIIGGAVTMRRFIDSLGWPQWAGVTLFLGWLFALFAATEIPFAYIGYSLDRGTGLSTQTASGWLKDLVKSLGLGLAATVVAGSVLVWLLASTPWWWLLAWVLGVAVSAVLGFLAPILLVPIFYRMQPIQEDRTRARFQALAARAGVPVVGVFELKASSKTTRSNAVVMGLGRTRRIVVTDTLLHDFAMDEIDAVLAHELAHQRHWDPARGFVAGSLVSLAIVAVTAALYMLLYGSFGILGPGDIAGLPLLVVLFSFVSLPFRPLELRRSRAREMRADLRSLGLIENPAAFASAMVRLHDRNLGVANPTSWEKWLFYSHPTGRERVELARTYVART
jgi:STE24 endopeptidase